MFGGIQFLMLKVKGVKVDDEGLFLSVSRVRVEKFADVDRLCRVVISTFCQMIWD